MVVLIYVENVTSDKIAGKNKIVILSAVEPLNTWCVQVPRSPKEAFAVAMQSWRESCEKCVCLQGDYVEE